MSTEEMYSKLGYTSSNPTVNRDKLFNKFKRDYSDEYRQILHYNTEEVDKMYMSIKCLDKHKEDIIQNCMEPMILKSCLDKLKIS